MSEAHRTSAWAKARNEAKPRLQAIIDAGSGWCFDGRHTLRPGAAWDVSHIVSVAVMKAAGVPENQWHRPESLAASCRINNRSAGGSAGARISNRNRAIDSGRVDEW